MGMDEGREATSSGSPKTRYHFKMALRREFYAWLEDRVRGRVVLDLGCGDWGGADLLARGPRKVLAVDLDPAALRNARAVTSSDRVRFLRMDARRLALDDDSVDAVVGVAFLEYVEDPRAALDEAFRVLTPGGVIALTTTNGRLAPKGRDGEPLYRSHFEEFTPEELRSALESRFDDVRLFGAASTGSAKDYLVDTKALAIESILVRTGLKERIPIQVRNFFRKLLTGVDIEQVIAEGFRIREGEHEDSIYVTGLGRKPAAPRDASPSR